MNPAVAEFFAQYGFDPAQPSALQPDRHFTPLMRAAKEGRLDVIEALLTYGVDIAVTNADGCNALWLACYNGSHAIIDRLIQAGIDIDRQNDNGATCLMYVASNSKPDLVSLLLERGANPRLANHDDFTALDLAGSLPCLKLLRAA
ncbi:ankyrin repeat domain-containing protein [Zoogloea sp.]|uniref:ankyrin repeat domain-containing protein n=1 Tax=Zoogloea sp. TaxID=49181 RepID=UPI002C900840|nr:ankyrin repeat domain-containing protein [Zoogloea sp.]HQA11560.1 ankyrin repeat domain-containing protein [Zoogloea sp.]HQE40432.1 ankyrin repeat domain-containing protein [Zoogloea sp.]